MTIPQDVRERAGLMPGAGWRVRNQGGRGAPPGTRLAPVPARRAVRSSSTVLRGGGDFKMTTDEILRLMRGRPADDDAPPAGSFSSIPMSSSMCSLEDETWGAWSEAALIDAAGSRRDRHQPDHLCRDSPRASRQSRRLIFNFRRSGVSPARAPVRGGLCRGTGVCRISPSRRRAEVSAAGFLHWRSRGGGGAHPVDPRRRAIRRLFSQGRADCAGMSR